MGCLGKHRESQHGLLGKSFMLYFQIILIVTLKFSDGGHVLLSHMWHVSSLVLSIAHVVVLYCIVLYGIRLLLALPANRGRAGAILSRWGLYVPPRGGR